MLLTCLAGDLRVVLSLVGNGHCSFWKLLLWTKTRFLVSVVTSAAMVVDLQDRTT
jgi:hypothetical protein